MQIHAPSSKEPVQISEKAKNIPRAGASGLPGALPAEVRVLFTPSRRELSAGFRASRRIGSDESTSYWPSLPSRK